MADPTKGGFEPRNLLIFGATGLIGQHILRAILDAKADFGSIVIFTSPDTIKRKADQMSDLKVRGAEIVAGNLENEEDVTNAYRGVDTVISCVGRNMIAAQIALIRLAAESPSVKWFFPSEYGTDIAYSPKSAQEKPHQKKLQVRAAMAEYEGALDYTYVVTGPFGDGDAGLYLSSNPNGVESGSFDARNKTAVLIENGHLKIGLTTMKDVGKLVLAALRHPKVSRNRILKVNSFYTTDMDILHEFEKQTGGKPWSVTYTPLEKLQSLEEEAWEAGNPFSTLYTLRRIWAEGGTIYKQTDNRLISAEDNMTSLAVAVTDAIRKQLGGSQQMNLTLK